MIATEQMKCCICKIEIDNGMDYHNPTPLGKNDSDDKVTQLYGDVCCTYCNITKVLPARIAQNKDQFQEQKAEEAKDVAVGERIKAENLSEPIKDLLKVK
jgi:hypothetical protein